MVDRSKKITELTAASNTVANSDLLVIVQNVGTADVETRKITAQALTQALTGGSTGTVTVGSTTGNTIVRSGNTGTVSIVGGGANAAGNTGVVSANSSGVTISGPSGNGTGGTVSTGSGGSSMTGGGANGGSFVANSGGSTMTGGGASGGSVSTGSGGSSMTGGGAGGGSVAANAGGVTVGGNTITIGSNTSNAIVIGSNTANIIIGSNTGNTVIKGVGLPTEVVYIGNSGQLETSIHFTYRNDVKWLNVNGNFTAANNIFVGPDVENPSFNDDRYGRFTYLDNTLSAYGFTFSNNNGVLLSNEQSTWNQVIVLGDTPSTHATNTIFGVAVSDFVEGISTGNTDVENWKVRINLSGTGDMFVHRSVNTMFFQVQANATANIATSGINGIIFADNTYQWTAAVTANYAVSAVSGTGYANVRLSDTSNVNDDIKFVGAGGVTVTQTDADTITITGGGDTTYTISAVTGANSAANVRLTSSGNANDDIALVGNNGSKVVYIDANTIVVNTQYTVSAVNGTGYANVRLTDIHNGNDDIKFIGNNGSQVLWIDADTIAVNTVYTVSAVSGTGYANVRLTDINNTNDDIKFVGAGGVTVAQTDANTITITGSGGGTTYTVSAVVGSGYANVRLTDASNGNDDVSFYGNNGTQVVYVDANTIVVNTQYNVSAVTGSGYANLRLTDIRNSNDDVKLIGSGTVSVAYTDDNTITITGAGGGGTAYNVSAVAGSGYANVRLGDSSNVNDDISFYGNNGTQVVYIDANTITVNTQYTVSAVSGTGYANIRLTDIRSTNDDIKLIGSGATTVTQTDADTVTISSTDTDTTYSISVVSTTGGANVRITSSSNANDDIKIASGNNATVAYTDANTLTVTANVDDTVYSGGNVSGTITPDRANGTVHKYTLTGNTTVNSISNISTGQSFTMILTQDGSGSRTGTFGASFKFAEGLKTLSTSASAIDMVNVFYDGTTYYATLTKGYA